MVGRFAMNPELHWSLGGTLSKVPSAEKKRPKGSSSISSCPLSISNGLPYPTLATTGHGQQYPGKLRICGDIFYQDMDMVGLPDMLVCSLIKILEYLRTSVQWRVFILGLYILACSYVVTVYTNYLAIYLLATCLYAWVV